MAFITSLMTKPNMKLVSSKLEARKQEGQKMLCPLGEDAEQQHFFPSRRRLRKAHGQQLSDALMECLGSHSAALSNQGLCCAPVVAHFAPGSIHPRETVINTLLWFGATEMQ